MYCHRCALSSVWWLYEPRCFKPTELYTRKINSRVLCNVSGCHLRSPVSKAGPASVCKDGLVPWEGRGGRHRRPLRQGLGC